MEASNQIVSCSMSAPHEVSPDCKSIPTRYTSRFSLVPNRVFVCGIDYETKGDELLHIFSHYGAVKDVRIVLDRFGMSKGYGFVTFQNQEDALKVLCDSNGVTLKHRRLCVSQAYRKQKRMPSSCNRKARPQPRPRCAPTKGVHRLPCRLPPELPLLVQPQPAAPPCTSQSHLPPGDVSSTRAPALCPLPVPVTSRVFPAVGLARQRAERVS
ncbi:protein boule-like isoform X3 [Nelusetta ayraudi]|uniref:protein boule-like isoform X3 n=1 Tax=Nelusetta ayraudi TaxID=303726 RepID=UPI003F71FB4D